MPPLAFSLSVSVRAPPSATSRAVCRRRPRACAEPAAEAAPPTRPAEIPAPAAPAAPISAPAPAASAPGPASAPVPVPEDSGASYVVVPGKIELTEAQLLEQRTRLNALEATFKQERLVKEYVESRKFGFVKYAELLNGRSAAFFFVVGLLTEYWTGYTIPQQVELMLNTVGIF